MKETTHEQKKILSYLEDKYSLNNFSFFDFDLKNISNELNIDMKKCHKNLIELSKNGILEEIDYTFNYWIPSNMIKDGFWEKITKNRVRGYHEHFKLHQDVCRISSFKNYFEEIKTMQENRGIIDYNILVCFTDFSSDGWFKIDLSQRFYLQNIFIRLVKTSQIVENLTLDGSYIEALSQLRNNFERSVTLIYLILNPLIFDDFIKFKKKQKSKNKYTIKFMTKKINVSYEVYRTLCNFVHVNLHDEDLQFIDEQGGFSFSQSYNKFDEANFKFLIAYNNNILTDTYKILFETISKEINYEEQVENTKAIFDSTNNLKNIFKFN